MIALAIIALSAAALFGSGFWLGRRQRDSVPVIPITKGLPTPDITPIAAPGRFRVVVGGMPSYQGPEGAHARRVVEAAKAGGEAGEFFDGGVRRDWWPR